VGRTGLCGICCPRHRPDLPVWVHARSDASRTDEPRGREPIAGSATHGGASDGHRRPGGRYRLGQTFAIACREQARRVAGLLTQTVAVAVAVAIAVRRAQAVAVRRAQVVRVASDRDHTDCFVAGDRRLAHAGFVPAGRTDELRAESTDANS